jgi:hypothetical protein
VRSNLNIGHRHLLPTFPATFVLCGASAGWIAAPQKWARASVLGLIVLLAVASVWMWPHYLAYFNLVAGGPANGYRHLVQSSLDWGQDLPGLKRWLDANRDGRLVYVAYHGSGDWRHYGIRARGLPRSLSRVGTGDCSYRPGVYCISATRLQQLYLDTKPWKAEYEAEYQQLRQEMEAFEQSPNEKTARQALLAQMDRGFRKRFKRFQELRFGRLCTYLRGREPDDQVGYSILIYYLSAEDLERALNGPVGEL